MSKTRTQIVEALWSEGKTVTQWAKDNGFSERAVRAVIAGHNKGNYGQAHHIAVALKIKGNPFNFAISLCTFAPTWRGWLFLLP